MLCDATPCHGRPGERTYQHGEHGEAEADVGSGAEGEEHLTVSAKNGPRVEHGTSSKGRTSLLLGTRRHGEANITSDLSRDSK